MSGATISVTHARTSYPAAAEAHPHGRRRHRITQLVAIAGGSHARYVIAVIYGYRRCYTILYYYIKLLPRPRFRLWPWPRYCFRRNPVTRIYNNLYTSSILMPLRTLLTGQSPFKLSFAKSRLYAAHNDITQV